MSILAILSLSMDDIKTVSKEIVGAQEIGACKRTAKFYVRRQKDLQTN